MKKLRLHIWILFGVFLTLFIIGSFTDLAFSEAVFSRNNGFGIFMSTIGTIPGYSCLAFLTGGYVTLAIKKDYKTISKIGLYVLALACFICAIYFSGREFFSPNGYNKEGLDWVGYLIVLPIMVGVAYLGYLVTKDSEYKHILMLYLCLAVVISLSLVGGTTILKQVFHRPRYRTLSIPEYTEIIFHNWWQRTPNYKDLMSTYNVVSEEFKSFPSGHSSVSMVFVLTVAFIPLMNKKYAKLQMPLMYAGLAWAVLVMFTRILVGAHFLSDVSMGAMLSIVFYWILNEVFISVEKKDEKVLSKERN